MRSIPAAATASLIGGLVCGLIMLDGCGREKKVPTPSGSIGAAAAAGKKPAKPSGNPALAHAAFPWEAEGKAVTGQVGGKPSIGQHLGRAPREEFHRRYSEGLRKMEENQLGDAMAIFEEIVKSFPGSDEASMAEYRLAMIHFQNKNNAAALETYKRILEKYPTSPMAENARAAVTYMETFEQHEKNYISPDVEDRQRRGR